MASESAAVTSSLDGPVVTTVVGGVPLHHIDSATPPSTSVAVTDSGDRCSRCSPASDAGRGRFVAGNAPVRRPQDAVDQPSPDFDDNELVDRPETAADDVIELPVPDLAALDAGCCFDGPGGFTAEGRPVRRGHGSDPAGENGGDGGSSGGDSGGAMVIPEVDDASKTTTTVTPKIGCGGAMVNSAVPRCRLSNHFRLVDDYTDRFERIPDSVRTN